MTTEFFLDNTRVDAIEQLSTPEQLRQELPASEQTLTTVRQARRQVERILSGADPRLLVVCGPCSIHDPRSALEYAQRLQELQAQVQDQMLLLMRVYFEKPRTTVGWKGLINDPDRDDSFDLEKGLRIGRQLLLDINTLGLGVATEALDPLSPQYLGELIAWSAIGARTTESQTHRELASGLSTPVGFKNGTDGSLEVAVNAMLSAQSPHAFLGVNAQGQMSRVLTRGNPFVHLILRGGRSPNYESAHVEAARQALEKAGLPQHIVVDCSHGNSCKDPQRQPAVLQDVVGQLLAGQRCLRGVMLESHLVGGTQKLGPSLVYGQSVTDACLAWGATQEALLQAHARLKKGV